ncbi:dermonecrotic toxin domain-containing protein [Pseudomonas pergaminensis]
MSSTLPPTPATADKGPHYSLIQRSLPAWLRDTNLPRAEALRATTLGIAPWYKAISQEQAKWLKAANARAWISQNVLDKRLDAVKAVHTFAEPLLVEALKTRHGIEDNVHDTYLFLHIEKGTVIKGTTSRTVSLLDAALQNFSKSETFSDSSSYISRPDQRGHFDVKPLRQRMSIKQFVTLCRELDLGAQYQQHLQQHLLPPRQEDKDSLKAQVIASQQAQLSAAIHMALAKKDITQATFHLLMRTLRGEQGVMQHYQLQMMDSLLTGILLIAVDLERASEVARVIAYIPHDPHSPVKDYPSAHAFMTELTDKLRTPGYRKFFSQFVDHGQREAFFTNLEHRLSIVQWHRRQDPLDSRPSWRDTPVTQPRLQYAALPITCDLWEQLYQQKLNKILNDARELAVSTADVDSRARWAWWDSVSTLLKQILNDALMLVTPFVPFLGELMMAYTAYQLLDEVVEGVVDLAEGQALEAAEHFLGILSETVELAAFGVGGKLAELLPSPFVNQLKPVQVQGKTRLWNPDLAPYTQKDLALPADSQPDTLGLHSHAGQRLLPLDDEHYAVSINPANGEHRIRHPSREDAYAPRLQHNGQGAWTHEAENPRTWDDDKLMRRLSHWAQALDGPTLEQIRDNSGTETGVLRAVHADNTPPPPLLLDTLKRFRINQQTHQLSQHIRAGEAADTTTYWSPHLAVELPGWPASKSIRVYEDASLTGDHLHFADAEAPDTLDISRQALNEGKLPEQLVDFLDEDQLQAMLSPLPTDRAARVTALRERLADLLASSHREVFNYLYGHSEMPGSTYQVLVRQTEPTLPKTLMQTLHEHARPEELKAMDEQRYLPLRLKNLARDLAVYARATHAHEGFYDPVHLTPDTERMTLNTLKRYSDVFADLRVEIREHSPIGELHCEAGPHDARQVRVVVRDPQGHYTLYDNDRQTLHAASDFYDALLQALPAERRAPWKDASALQAWLMEHLATLEERRTALDSPPAPPAVARTTEQLLQKPMFQWASKMLCVGPPSLESRIKALYPKLREEVIRERVQLYDSPDGEQALKDLEREKKVLLEQLDHWVQSPTRYHGGDRVSQDAERMVRLVLSKKIRHCWEDVSIGFLDAFGEANAGGLLNLEKLPLAAGLYPETLPTHAFEFVTALNINKTEFHDGIGAFLSLFPNLRTLDLSDNQLTRLPEALTGMPRLTQLGLGSNPLRWDSESLEKLENLTHLNALDLSNNRLMTTAPNVSRMSHLRELYLDGTGIDQWPEGLFDQPRSEHFHLDLQNTQVTTVPQFLPWQPQAEIVARTRLDRNRLNLDDQERLVSYRIAAGLDPYRTYPPRGAEDSLFWIDAGLSDTQRASLQQRWDELEQEHGSQGFFEVIRSLQMPDRFDTFDDQLDYINNRPLLTQKVWRMLNAMHGDEPLRRLLFEMAGVPGNCADAGTQIFNNMGIETLLHELYRKRPRLAAPVFASRLAHLARQTARLDLINQAARREVARRLAPPEQGGLGLRLITDVVGGVPGTVDEVEVYLALQTALKHNMRLPWISTHMTYRRIASVDQTLIGQVRQAIVNAERRDGLVDNTLKVPFWDQYLKATHGDALARSNLKFQEDSARILELKDAQDEWAKAQASGAPDLAERKQTLTDLADELDVPHDHVLTGAPMTDSTYQDLFDQLNNRQRALGQQLTRDALNYMPEFVEP